MSILTWIGIALCLSQSALFSGMNLGLFSIGTLPLEVEARRGSADAERVLALRRNGNFALATILWGNVGANVLLALLTDSVLSGIAAFVLSTVMITIFAEIVPQAYCTRHALFAAARLAPWLRAYQLLLYPVARPTAWALDAWLGGEEIRWYREPDLRRVIQLHMEAAGTDIARVEGQGALNFLDIDETPLHAEGEPLASGSVLSLAFDAGRPVFPAIAPNPDDPFLQAVVRSGRSWVVLTDQADEPRLVLRVNPFLREALFHPARFDPARHCRRPIVVRDASAQLGGLITRFRVRAQHAEDDLVDDNVILFWGDAPRIVTGTDVLGRLLRGIARPTAAVPVTAG